MAYYLTAGDVISGQEAEVRFRNRETGVLEEAFHLVDLEATADFNIQDFRSIGKRGVQHKTSGWTGTGTMTLYYISSTFRQYLADYERTGVPAYFDIILINRDAASSIGIQSVLLGKCQISSMVAGKVDINQDVLDETLDFVFDEFDLVEPFNLPAGAV